VGAVDARALAAEEAELFAGLTPRGQVLAMRLSINMATRAASQPPTLDENVMRVLPLPAPVRRLLLRQLLQRLIPDADSYIFTNKRNAIQDRAPSRLGCGGRAGGSGQSQPRHDDRLRRVE
jgi:hypothetical protein